MTERDLATLQRELAELRSRVAQLEDEEAGQAGSGDRDWMRPFYLTYYATTGFFLGMISAAASLLFNVAGAWLTGKHPLQLIRVYLTFGLGEKALDLQLGQGDAGLTLIIGCCLYIATGMLLGVLFQVVLGGVAENVGLLKRLGIASVLALAVWIVSYYLILSWLQWVLFGGSWIVAEIPWWVGALTHLVFGWTMAVLYPLGTFKPYRVVSN